MFNFGMQSFLGILALKHNTVVCPDCNLVWQKAITTYSCFLFCSCHHGLMWCYVISSWLCHLKTWWSSNRACTNFLRHSISLLFSLWDLSILWAVVSRFLSPWYLMIVTANGKTDLWHSYLLLKKWLQIYNCVYLREPSEVLFRTANKDLSAFVL